MRRSNHLFAPILAATAMATIAGCSEGTACPPRTTCSPTNPGTLFGGFGESFLQHPGEWIFDGAALLFVVFGVGS